MGNSFETTRYTEEALRKVDALIREFFLRDTGEEADASTSPRWSHRKISWTRLDTAYEDYEITIEGACSVRVKDRMTPAPYRELKAEFRLLVNQSRGIPFSCGKAAGVLTLTRPEEKKVAIKFRSVERQRRFRLRD